MEAIILQSISFVVLVLLFIYVFRRYPLQPSVKKLVLAAIFVLLSVILNALSVMIPFLGFPSVKISFALLPLMIGGAILSPSWAYLVGFTCDVLGLIITPTSFPFLGFTLSHVLVAVLPSLWYQRSENIKPQKIRSATGAILIALAVFASIYVFTLTSVPIGDGEFIVTFQLKLILSIFVFGMAFIINIVLSYLQRRMSDQVSLELAQWMFIVVFIEIFNNMLLTPFWLQSMYHIPWYLSSLIRIVKACIMIPLNIMIGYHLVKIVKRVSSK